jgi:hypothetical protein
VYRGPPENPVESLFTTLNYSPGWVIGWRGARPFTGAVWSVLLYHGAAGAMALGGFGGSLRRTNEDTVTHEPIAIDAKIIPMSFIDHSKYQ